MFLFLFLIFMVAFFTVFMTVKKLIIKKVFSNHSQKNYFSLYVAIWSLIPAIITFIGFYILANNIITSNIIIDNIKGQSQIERDIAYNQIQNVVQDIKDKKSFDDISIYGSFDKQEIYEIAQKYLFYKNLSFFSLLLFVGSLIIFTAYFLIRKVNFTENYYRRLEKIIEKVLLIFASIAILTTIGIVLALFIEAFKFFKQVSILRFIFGLKWAPEDYLFDIQNSFGIIPLVIGTFLISFIAVIFAIFIGVSAAVYMSEYMTKRYRKMIKPMLEILAGIPSIVYGFFAAIFFAPFLVGFFSKVFGLDVSSENALNAGIVMGIMIIPFLSSITDDVLRSIPNYIREGGYAVGSMKNEVVRKILLPAAAPGIAGGVLLAVSRAIGETMVVVMASSLAANLTINPLEPVTTITTQIVMLVQGDQEFNSAKTLSAFALGFILLLLTLVLNLIAIKIVNKYKGLYD